MRLVVDTGLHAKGWSRERAIDFMLENSGMTRTEVVAEVERYIAIPSQALAYKVEPAKGGGKGLEAKAAGGDAGKAAEPASVLEYVYGRVIATRTGLVL